jgi:hypothetical protein
VHTPNGQDSLLPRGRRAGGLAHSARLFAGLRLDPNFIDVPRYIETLATRRIAFQVKGTNATNGLNVLSIVVELDAATVLASAPGTLFAVAMETVTAGKYPLRLERVGRVEIKNQLLTEYGVDPVNRDLDLRELYNQEDPFQLAPYYVGPTARG